MKIHPEMREQFDEAMRYHMAYWRKLTPEQIAQKMRAHLLEEQKALFGNGDLVGTVKHTTVCKAFCYPWCQCPSTTAIKLERKPKDGLTKRMDRLDERMRQIMYMPPVLPFNPGMNGPEDYDL